MKVIGGMWASQEISDREERWLDWADGTDFSKGVQQEADERGKHQTNVWQHYNMHRLKPSEIKFPQGSIKSEFNDGTSIGPP